MLLEEEGRRKKEMKVKEVKVKDERVTVAGLLVLMRINNRERCFLKYLRKVIAPNILSSGTCFKDEFCVKNEVKHTVYCREGIKPTHNYRSGTDASDRR